MQAHWHWCPPKCHHPSKAATPKPSSSSPQPLAATKQVEDTTREQNTEQHNGTPTAQQESLPKNGVATAQPAIKISSIRKTESPPPKAAQPKADAAPKAPAPAAAQPKAHAEPKTPIPAAAQSKAPPPSKTPVSAIHKAEVEKAARLV